MTHGSIIINPGCTLSCAFCSPRHPKHFSIKEWLQNETDVIKNIDYLFDHGVKNIEISGCDPGECRNLPKIIQYAKKYAHVMLSTNGIRFSDPSLAQELVVAGLDSVRIPLYGHSPEIHDRLTGSPGSFELQRQAIINFLKAGTHLVAYSVITKWNKNDLDKILITYLELVNQYALDKYTALEKIIFSIPCIASKENLDYYVPYREMGPYFKKLLESTRSISNNLFIIKDVPYCVIGGYDPRLDNLDSAESLHAITGSQLPSKDLRSDIDPTVPSYRIKVRIENCEGCQFKQKCFGFYKNDIDIFGY